MAAVWARHEGSKKRFPGVVGVVFGEDGDPVATGDAFWYDVHDIAPGSLIIFFNSSGLIPAFQHIERRARMRA